MPTKKTKPEAKVTPPYDHARSFERITVHVPPADEKALEEIAARLAEPGCKPNVSAAFRHVLREYLAREKAQKKNS